MLKRKRIRRVGRDRRRFSITAARTRKRNISPKIFRGGYRL